LQERSRHFFFLSFHLIGVVDGSRLHSLARKEMGTLAPTKNILRVIGHGPIYVGILDWAPYFYLKLVAQQELLGASLEAHPL